MIDFKNPELAVPNALTVAAILIVLGTAGYRYLDKPPDIASVSIGHGLAERQTREEIQKTQDKAEALRDGLAPKFWQGNPVDVTASILQKLTTETNRYGLTLTSFRPDTVKALNGFTELKFTVQVSGAYPNVRSLLTAVDGGTDKVALGSVQIAASPNQTNSVQATLSISAYLLTDQTLLPTKGGASHA